MKILKLIATAIVAAFVRAGFAWAYCSLREIEWPVDICTLPDAAAHRDDSAAHLIADCPDDTLHEFEGLASSASGQDCGAGSVRLRNWWTR